MSYEDAPATKMLNTHCAACGKPLVDAESVTAGMGPLCRRKHGHLELLDEDTRREANRLVHLCARAAVQPDVLVGAIVELALLGCQRLAKRISERAGRVVVVVRADCVDVDSPYRAAFVENRGRGRWRARDGVTRYPRAYAVDAAEAIGSAYPTYVMRFHADPHAEADFITLPALAERLCEVAAGHAEPVDAPVKAAAKGTPSRLRGSSTWGVCLPRATRVEPGDVVEVKTRAGEVYHKRLVRLDSRPRWGDVWETDSL